MTVVIIGCLTQRNVLHCLVQPIAALWASPTHCKSFIIHRGQFAKSHAAASLVMCEMRISPVDVKALNLLKSLKGNQEKTILKVLKNWLSWQVRERSPLRSRPGCLWQNVVDLYYGTKTPLACQEEKRGLFWVGVGVSSILNGIGCWCSPPLLHFLLQNVSRERSYRHWQQSLAWDWELPDITMKSFMLFLINVIFSGGARSFERHSCVCVLECDLQPTIESA